MEKRLEIAERIICEVHPYLVAVLSSDCPEDAVEDVLQETLIAITQKLHTCSHTTHNGVKWWCLGIARHKRADYFRDKHVRRAKLFDPDSYETLIDLSAVDRKISREEREQLNYALDLLKVTAPEDAALLIFRYFEELSLAEIALITGSTEDAVRMRLVRACKRAAKLVKSKGEI